MGVERGAPRGRIVFIRHQRAQLGTFCFPFFPGGVEDVGDSSPPGPAGQHLLLFGGSGLARLLHLA